MLPFEKLLLTPYMGFPKIRRSFLEGPYYTDYRILGYVLGVPWLGKVPHIPAKPLVLSNHFVDSFGAASAALGQELEPTPFLLVM